MIIKTDYYLLDKIHEKKEVLDSFIEFLKDWNDKTKSYMFLTEISVFENYINISMNPSTPGIPENFQFSFFIDHDFTKETLISSFEKNVLDKKRKRKEEAELIIKLKETKEWQNLQEGYDLIPKQYNYIF